MTTAPIDEALAACALKAARSHPAPTFGCVADAIPGDRATALGVVWRLIPHGTPHLTDIAEADWQKARRRFEVIRALAQDGDAFTGDAGGNRTRLQPISGLRLLARYEANPRLTSLLPERRGRRHGQFRLATEVDEIISGAIEEIYLTRQKPSIGDW